MNHEKLIGAGVALLLSGAVLGWGASRMAPTGAAATPAGVTGVVAQETPGGSVTPTVRYRTPRRTTVSGFTVPAGTPLSVAVNTGLNSKTAVAGQTWTGEMTEDVYAGERLAIPAGSPVRGTVLVSEPAVRGSRARLQLALSSVNVRGRSYTLRGASESVVAGSPRVRNVGAIAGGTAAGALIGRAVSKSTKGTVIGAVVGGSAATAAVAASKGYQADIDPGTRLSFTTSRSVTVRRA